jgi:hypothetical protein
MSKPTTGLARVILEAATERQRQQRRARSFEVIRAAQRLAPALEKLALVPLESRARPELEEVSAAWHALFRATLPDASAEVHGALTRLCVIEGARHRMKALPKG